MSLKNNSNTSFLLGARKALPSPFAVLESLTKGGLLGTPQIVGEVATMPDLAHDIEGLDGWELERVCALYAFIAHAYLKWTREDKRPLPANIARPWVVLSERLGRPPAITYAASVLSNYTWKDSTREKSVENVQIATTFTGSEDEEWFYAIHVAVEASGADALAAMPTVHAAIARGDDSAVIQGLGRVSQSILKMNATMKRMPERCKPDYFFHVIRPYLGSLKEVVYDGVLKWQDTPQSFSGASGAQSTLVPCLDAFLDVEHTTPVLTKLLLDMRRYMPTEHVRFLEDLEARDVSVRDYTRGVGSVAAAQAYNACVDALAEFRRIHRSYASRFISAKGRASEGTGGTPFVRYLTAHLEDTRAAIVPVSHGALQALRRWSPALIALLAVLTLLYGRR